ncbi:hypothetical protein FANTH_10034 [Fusarium anthophilum]|uniref:Zn(2)-C6 fungal-type domain-containing protein n=1 Tax=Fusarium anthophilum TaxID=48485 RepID=A0A8H4Z2W9_9HYPO|nr:hypothetical protein FANTH_10034 [Fusarium anthophilum]
MKPTRKSRARQACRACNARRVRCDVIATHPCTNCRDHQVVCELRESKRGRHRKPNLLQTPKSPGNNDSISVASVEQQQQQDHLVFHADTAPPASSEPTGPTTNCVAPSSASTERTQVTPAHSSSVDQVHETQTACDISWEPPRYQHQQQPKPQQQHDDGQGNQVQERPEDDETVFLGESTSITYLHGTHPSPVTLSTPEQGFVYRLPQGLNAKSLTSAWELERKQARLSLLQLEGAFSFPNKSAVDKVLAAYFQWFHPCFAIVDEPHIWDQHGRNAVPPLLLQAMLFIGVMHCSESDLQSVGLGSRQRAKYILYNRAKSLFDAEAEPKSLIVIQALFLLSFYRAGPLLQKDTRHWLAVAISQAQTKGLHRASRDEKDKTSQLKKRIWWSIYVRERQCAAALGLPNRVRDEDCDIGALNEQDFQYAFGVSSSPSWANKSIFYMIGMVELSRMLGRIMHRDFLPSKRLSPTEREEFRVALVDWRTSLPACMQLSSDEPSCSMGFLPGMLHMAYNNLLILLFRSGCGNLGDSSGRCDGRVAIQAAARNSAIIEELVTENQMRHGQIHVITNVFNTLCIHTLHLQGLQGGPRFVAEHRAKLCLVSLQELQQTWEFKNWILQLFFQYLDHPTALRLRMEDGNGEGMTPQQQPQEGECSVSPNISPNVGMLPGQHETQNDNLHIDTSRLTDVTWPIEVENVGQFLHTQIEDRFINGDGGAIDWYMADLFNNTLPP